MLGLIAVCTSLPFGANVDETSIQRVVEVPSASNRTLHDAFKRARDLLAKGQNVKIRIAPGTYRESVLDIDWKDPMVRESVLVVEGVGKVIWSGTDTFPLSSWKREGNLLKHPWPYSFGNFGYSWGTKKVIGHRVEMAFLNNYGLMPRILEDYKIGGVVQDPAKTGQVTYEYQGFRRPEQVLEPGQFGVTERTENGRFIYVCLPKGVEPKEKDIEVSVRQRLLDMSGKDNLVIRNITFFGAASSERGFSSQNGLTLGIPEDGQRNLLIDRCQFLWNANNGLQLAVSDATIRNSVFRYNGASGLSGGKSRNVLFENNDMSFNVWRAWRGGEIGYYTGGFKMHEVDGHRIRGHTSLGNLTMGLWWDVHCKKVDVENVTAIDNSANIHFELSQGPFRARRMLVAGGRYFAPVNLWICGNVDLEDSIIYSNYLGKGDGYLLSLHCSDRDDPHANMEPILTGYRHLSRNLFVGGDNTRDFAALDDVRDPNRPNWQPMVYEGKDNIFWSPRAKDLWKRWADDWPQLAAQPNKVKKEAWLQDPTYREVQPTQLNPRFRDPLAGDFRVPPSSPAKEKNPNLPFLSLSQQQLKDMRRFFEWTGYKPGVWSEIPAE
jgi:hypothetical protein